MKAQFRASAYNLGNTVMFPGPNTTFGDSAFGTVAGTQQNDPRIVELGLKVNF